MSKQQHPHQKAWEQAKEKAFDYYAKEDQFTFYEEKENIKISYLTHKEGNIVRGDGLVKQCTAKEFMEILNTKDLKTLDTKCKAFKILEEWKEEQEEAHWSIRYMIMASPSMMVSDRSFLYISKEFKQIDEKEEGNNNNVLYLITTSIEGNKEEEEQVTPMDLNNKTVRGTNIFQFHRLEELKDGNLKVCFMGQANPNGYIPTMVSNAVIYDRPLAVVRIAKKIGKEVVKA
ncbi:hypothetical protein ABK040_002229 [Willaertia magna]